MALQLQGLDRRQRTGSALQATDHRAQGVQHAHVTASWLQLHGSAALCGAFSACEAQAAHSEPQPRHCETAVPGGLLAGYPVSLLGMRDLMQGRRRTSHGI